MIKKGLLLSFLAFIHIDVSARQQPKIASQNPSPMIENIRPHNRVSDVSITGIHEEWPNLLPKTVHFFCPENTESDSINLLIHFHGSQNVVNFAISQNSGWAAITVNLGSGSSVYARPFSDDRTLDKLIETASKTSKKPIRAIYLSGWSAGYGAIRSILRSENKHTINGIILLDGMHAGYIPKGTPLADGGKIDRNDLSPFMHFAKSSLEGKTQFIFTHSEVFPGTYASTTECADYLTKALGLDLQPLLAEGPLGMQQLAKASKGNLSIIAYAGNSAPDHVDHLHALYWFLGLLKCPPLSTDR
ncbi:hypothetical protein DN752_20525 [Echinicola strongylocentroti]|uniref:Alpha/beta hydrolase n=2 Tax=Echinicola strongylocentroti TaxID=1795355 RepID=A0A2Z4IMJ9_9BACT|nr:hypothetical protein DN752_20525 [Echinicola strongylocentroti]